MRDKILTNLLTKYPGVSKRFLGLWADKLSAKVTEESQIEGVINELDNLPISIPDLAAELQTEGDRRVAAATKKIQTTTSNNPKTEDETKSDDDTPAWAKSLMQEVQTLKQEKSQTSIQQKITEKLKDVPAVFYKGRIPASEDQIDIAAKEIQDDYTAYKQDQINGSGGNPPKTGIGFQGGNATAAAVLADIEGWNPQGKVLAKIN